MGLRVLVVDDDELSREVLAVLLQGAGYAVEAVDSGDAALLSLRSVRPLPEVVLADMQMPGTAGGELARRMRGVCGGCTVLLAMSGSELEGDAGREFDGFLLKPFSMEELAGAIAGGAASVERASNGKGVGVLDERVYAKLATSMRRSKLEELYAMCVEDAEGRIAKMQRAASDGDAATYVKEAHAIQGGCGMVGATELQTLATSIEKRGLCGDHVASLDELLRACKRLRRILIAYTHEDDRFTGVSGEDAR
jgi:CheY-like chemotaxis protein/HPt (histidine-containing phosphotransfer) domain-containing protein